MAEKRFIHRRFLEGDKIRQLANEGKERACFYYAAFLAHFDREGRMNANPLLLKGSLLEGYDVTPEEIGDALFDLARVGLVILYENGRHSWLIQCTKFLVEDGGFNRPHPKEPPSTIPGPDDAGSELRVLPPAGPKTSGNIPGNVRGKVEVYGEGKGKVEGEEERTSTSLTRATDHTPFLEAWNQHRGNLPAVRTLDAKRKRALDQLRKEHGDQAINLFTAATMHVAADDFWIERGYGLDNLLRPGRVLEKAEKHAANNGMTASERKLATTADIIARAIGGMNA